MPSLSPPPPPPSDRPRPPLPPPDPTPPCSLPGVPARRFYYAPVGHGSHAALTCAALAFGADHILPGSDFPVLLAFESYERTFAWIREVDLPPADINQMLEETAPTVLKLPRDS